MQRLIEIICAVRNEASSLQTFVDSVRRLNVPDCILQMTFIEDGSTDSTVAVLKELAISSDDISYYSLFNPYGQGFALAYGIFNSTADAIITMDVDGSHPLAIAENMIRLYLADYDIIQGNRVVYNRNSFYRKIASKLYFNIFSLLTGVNLYKQNVHFRLMSSKAIDKFRKSPKTWYSARLKNMNNSQFRLYYIDFEAPERTIGQSKFNFKRLLYFAYHAFLTLTDKSIFLLLNIIIGIFAILCFTILPWFSIIIFIAGGINAWAYYKANQVDYFKRIEILDVYRQKVTLD